MVLGLVFGVVEARGRRVGRWSSSDHVGAADRGTQVGRRPGDAQNITLRGCRGEGRGPGRGVLMSHVDFKK